MSINKTTKDILGSSVMLGVGGSILEGMGQGSIIPNTIGKAGGMVGNIIPAVYGMEVLKMVSPQRKRRRR